MAHVGSKNIGRIHYIKPCNYERYLYGGSGATALLEASLWRVKPSDLLVRGRPEAGGARPGSRVNSGHVYISIVPGRGATDPSLSFLEDTVILWSSGELLAHQGLFQLCEYLHHEGTDLGVGLVRILDPLSIANLVGVNERLSEVNIWFAYRRLMKRPLKIFFSFSCFNVML